jgi:hypothetical protein
MKKVVLVHFRNHWKQKRIARCGFPWEKSTKRLAATVYAHCETAIAVLAIASCFPPVWGQNAGQIIAAQYGEFQVSGSTIGGFYFPPATCQVSAGGQNFNAFSVGTPVKIVDSNPSLTEVATPTSVFINVCSVNMVTAHNHVPPYYLTSGTGGLQEAITANQTVNGANTIVLNAQWYNLIAPANAASIIASVHGIADLGLVDVTTTPNTYYQWNGTQYVPVSSGGGSGGSYNQGGSGAVTQTVTFKLQQTISVKDFGAVGDGAHMAADTAGLQAAVAAATATGQSVYIPAGSYLLNNASGPALSGANNVAIYGDGPSSSLVCQMVGASDCIASTGATGFALRNLSISFGPAATQRTSGYAVDIQSCTNCSFEGLTLNNGDLSGMRLASSVHTQMHNVSISNFFANGLFSINNQDLRVDGESCYNNQDACFETSWFDSQYSVYGIPCQNITATNITSNTDTEAILINACNNVSVNGFTALNSGKESVWVGQDPTTTTAHWPDRVSIANGSIYGAGYGTNANNTPTAQALLINVGTSPGSFISHISYSNISATHISGWGLQMAELQNDDVQASNLSFYDVGNGNSVGCLQTEGNQVNLANVQCTNIGTYGLYDTNTNRLTGTELNFNAVSQVSGTQSIYLSATATGLVNITNVSVNDTNPTTFSSSIFDNSSSGNHSIWNIWLTGLQTPTDPSPGVNGNTTFTYSNTGHSMVFKNGGMIQSFVPPNYYFLPTAGATPTSYVNGAVLYYQSKCWASGAQQTESVGWLDQYLTLSTESFSFNQFGGCGFPITIDMTKASSVLEPQTNITGTASAQHFSGYASGTYASAPTAATGTGGGTGATIALDAQSSDVSGYVSVTPGSSPAASSVVVTLAFGNAYSTHAKCMLTAANSAAALLSGATQVYVPVPTTTAFQINSGTTALAASTLYTWGYTCTQ